MPILLYYISQFPSGEVLWESSCGLFLLNMGLLRLLGSNEYRVIKSSDVKVSSVQASVIASISCMLEVIMFFSFQQAKWKYYHFSFCFRWAQFFIHPLMMRDAINREVEAIDNGKSNITVICLFLRFSAWSSWVFIYKIQYLTSILSYSML